MRLPSTAKASLLVAILLALSFATSGCVKAYISIDVNPDGAGTIGAAFGMTAAAKAFAGSQGIADPVQAISEEVAQDADTEDVRVERWTDGDYEWIEATVPFNNLDDLNSRMRETDLFESFQLTQRSDFLKKYYVLDAVIAPSFLASEASQDYDFDPSGMFEIRLAVTLPGAIVESNGIAEKKDSNTMSWTLTSDTAMVVHAASENWNWTNIILLVAGGLFVFVLGIGVIGLGIYLASRQRAFDA